MDHQDLLSRVRDVAATSDSLGQLLKRLNAALERDEQGAEANGGCFPAPAGVAPSRPRAKRSLTDVSTLLAASKRLLAASDVARDASRALIAAMRAQRDARRGRCDRATAEIARSRALLDRAGHGGDGAHRASRRGTRGSVAPLLHKLERLGPLSGEGRRALESSPLDARPVGADRDLIRDDERPSHCLLLLDGMACRYKLLEDGRRRIVSLHVPGDLLDVSGLLLGEMDYAVATLTPVVVAAIPHATVLGWVEDRPSLGLGGLLWRDAMTDAAIMREWLVNAGRRTARERTAHLLCELATRMRAAGLARGDACDLPISQVKLADALGLSSVHVNRVIQSLRGRGLIEFGGGVLVVRDRPGLERAGGFDPRYLHRLAAAA